MVNRLPTDLPVITRRLAGLKFDNSFIRELPADPETKNHPRQVVRSCYSRVVPTKVKRPKLVAYVREVAEQLELSNITCETDNFTQVFAGNLLSPGMDPYATCYGGHQFGNWAGQLGDGRIINLGETVNQQGDRFTLQLKGAGLTPYSRTADGLAVLRSSVREFLCSEAMHHLGVPTTRALSLVQTGEQVIRDMFYDGNPKLEPGAIVCRVAQSFTRFGNFEILRVRGENDILQQLVDYTIRVDFPDLGKPSSEVYTEWFKEICRRTAAMIVHWMRVGFVHGVMNTDNMSILGLTIDYGPYGWLEGYDPNWTPNTTDALGRRYRFGNQPQIALWNLAQLANALLPLVKDTELLQQALEEGYVRNFERGWQATVAEKLGFKVFDPKTDQELNTELLEILQLVETDMTIFYRTLALLNQESNSLNEVTDETLMASVMAAYYLPEQLTNQYKARMGKWLRKYIKRLSIDGISHEARQAGMNAVNPKYVLRNYMAQLAIDKAEKGDNSLVYELLDLLRHPYDEQPEKEKFAQKRPDWARSRAGCSMLSCSS